MATIQALMGTGVPPLTAGLLGTSVQAVAGAGTAQGTATAILKDSKIVQVTGASSNTGAILPDDAQIGDIFYVSSLASDDAVIYCPVGHTLNGTSNGGCTFSAEGTIIFIRTGLTTWVCTGTATGTVA